MNYDTATLADKLHAMGELLNDVKKVVILRAQESDLTFDEHVIAESAQLGQQLNQRRKELDIDLATLELQTGVSASTLKRLFKDPDQVKFGTVLRVADALGVKLCAAV
ncbi:helix-turn-helix domain-containing protein [Buttiauxella sp. A2-C1_F]|uniref:helix-turn-helix domain-containing protein n=1 Tax=unclassified Buttiauxella TaxID=2634062 RepID=UPI001E54D091|nr:MULTISPECIES: helix-turn-helix domain-containing protein [unclassified Buttiauxella]MCE0799122.1 helix-turn-helix domain-containing protein [Buttiauxella sp. W03-F01]MCE0844320.1 helix-turn-helix domain-containing protein [Buttiauxella sp. A2-C1_F]